MNNRFVFRVAVKENNQIQFAYSNYNKENPSAYDLKLCLEDGNWIVYRYDWVDRDDFDCLEWVRLYADNVQISSVEQRTDLKDKNGNFIYEGDIVEYKIPAIPKIKAIVCWGPTACHFWKGVQDLATYQKSTVIIGNVHENSELISKTETYKYL